MKKIDLIDVISKEISITRSEAKQSVEIIIEEISRAVISGKGVEVRGLAGFKNDIAKEEWGLTQKPVKRLKFLKNLYLFLSLESFLKKPLIKADIRLIIEH